MRAPGFRFVGRLYDRGAAGLSWASLIGLVAAAVLVWQMPLDGLPSSSNGTAQRAFVVMGAAVALDIRHARRRELALAVDVVLRGRIRDVGQQAENALREALHRERQRLRTLSMFDMDASDIRDLDRETGRRFRGAIQGPLAELGRARALVQRSVDEPRFSEYGRAALIPLDDLEFSIGELQRAIARATYRSTRDAMHAVKECRANGGDVAREISRGLAALDEVELDIRVPPPAGVSEAIALRPRLAPPWLGPSARHLQAILSGGVPVPPEEENPQPTEVILDVPPSQR